MVVRWAAVGTEVVVAALKRVAVARAAEVMESGEAAAAAVTWAAVALAALLAVAWAALLAVGLRPFECGGGNALLVEVAMAAE